MREAKAKSSLLIGAVSSEHLRLALIKGKKIHQGPQRKLGIWLHANAILPKSHYSQPCSNALNKAWLSMGTLNLNTQDAFLGI